MTMTMTAEAAVARVEKTAHEIASRRTHVRDCSRVAIGQVVRQGDLYLLRVEDDHPRGKRTKNRQLADGATQGSRHVAEEPLEVYEGKALPAWFRDTGRFTPGPVIVNRTKSLATVSHPEHSHDALPGGTTWQVTHQLDWASQQRVID